MGVGGWEGFCLVETYEKNSRKVRNLRGHSETRVWNHRLETKKQKKILVNIPVSLRPSFSFFLHFPLSVLSDQKGLLVGADRISTSYIAFLKFYLSLCPASILRYLSLLFSRFSLRLQKSSGMVLFNSGKGISVTGVVVFESVWLTCTDATDRHTQTRTRAHADSSSEEYYYYRCYEVTNKQAK